MNKEHIQAQAIRNVAQRQAKDKAKDAWGVVFEKRNKALEEADRLEAPIAKEAGRLTAFAIEKEEMEVISKIEKEEIKAANDEYEATTAKLKKEGK